MKMFGMLVRKVLPAFIFKVGDIVIWEQAL